MIYIFGLFTILSYHSLKSLLIPLSDILMKNESRPNCENAVQTLKDISINGSIPKHVLD